MPSKNSNAYRKEYVRVHYGIHSDTLDVKSVWEQRDGGLSGDYGTHYPSHGMPARSEVMLVFHLTEVRTVMIQLEDTQGIRIVAELEEKAKQMRAERDAKEKHNG
ncbi:hypothetical protein [Rhizobium laguerreae]|uniref:hypothetical protein n=1 Tax=Rhizobium laguerreae TaxID=1076926 RepID=UPI001442753F|nr:hypothetical protein [Rhizobium laguerreae]NKM30100.1 hypothetical protein [Rhizobium laguerreae]